MRLRLKATVVASNKKTYAYDEIDMHEAKEWAKGKQEAGLKVYYNDEGRKGKLIALKEGEEIPAGFHEITKYTFQPS